MKQYMLKKWLVIIASLMAVSQSFAKGGNTVHLVITEHKDGSESFKMYLPPAAPRRAETHDAGTQTDAVPAVAVVPERREEELSGSGRALADLKARGASDLVVLTRELLDELAYVAKCVLPNDREFGTSGISLSDRFATLQEQDAIKRATLKSLDKAKEEEFLLSVEEEEIFKALEKSQEELETEDAIALVEVLKDSEEAKQVAIAINESLREAKKRVNTRQVAILLVKMAFVRRVILDALVRQALLRAFLQELVSPREPREPVISPRTCRQECLATSHVFHNGQSDETGSDSRTPAPTVLPDPTPSFDDDFNNALRRGFADARARDRSVFEPASRQTRAMQARRRAEQASPTSVVQLVVPAAPELVAASRVRPVFLEKLEVLYAKLADFKIVFRGGVCVDLVGDSIRRFVESMQAGEIPTSEQVAEVFKAREAHIKSITRMYAKYRKQTASFLIASSDVIREVVTIAFREIVQAEKEQNGKVLALNQMRSILGSLNEEKEDLKLEFRISSATVVSVEES